MKAVTRREIGHYAFAEVSGFPVRDPVLNLLFRDIY